MLTSEVFDGIDAPIKKLVKVLNDNGFETIASCSGHGKMPGNIVLRDGREILIVENYEKARRIEKVLIENGLYKPLNH